MMLLISCEKNDSPAANGPRINFIYKFDSTQARLNAFGLPAPVAAGNAAQSPKFKGMSSHYVELSKDQFTALGSGAVLYRAAETAAGGANAIDFSKASYAENGQIFLSLPLSSITAGTYNWMRISLSYQNYNVMVNASGQTLNATIASFIGFRNYIQQFKIKDSTVVVNANKDQGFWAFEANAGPFGVVNTGQAPAGATTVPNPLFASSPIPQGSCVVTGQFSSGLIISGNETTDINIIVSLSTNKSFEWKNNDGNNTFDPLNGDQVVDMGIRGLIPSRQ
ncbi:MAG: hypothetical protein ABIQ56_03915 [Chitinophagaceae bacterium]